MFSIHWQRHQEGKVYCQGFMSSMRNCQNRNGPDFVSLDHMLLLTYLLLTRVIIEYLSKEFIRWGCMERFFPDNKNNAFAIEGRCFLP